MHPLFFLIFHICCLVSAKKLGGGEQGHSFLVKQRNGQVFGWGSNRYGMLGIGSTKLTWPNPKTLVNVVSARDVSVSLTHSCIVDQGQAKCAGLGYFLGRTSTYIDSNVMVPVEGLNETDMVSRVFLGEQHSCILTKAGAVWCWGYEEDGRTANPTTGLIASPRKVTGYGADKVTIDVATSDHTCILLSDGTVGCAGRNTEGQLGVGDTENRFTLTQVQGGLVNVVSISAGTACTCAVTQNGDVYCWGGGYFGGLELGQNVVDKTVPTTKVLGIPAAADVLCSYMHTLVILQGNRSMVGFGYNAYGTLIEGGEPMYVLNPTALYNGQSGILEVRGGLTTACILLGTGQIKCLGADNYSQLGRGSSEKYNNPLRPVKGITVQLAPTKKPTRASTVKPTKKPSTHKPSKSPSPAPIKKPTKEPTVKPTKKAA